MGMTSAAHKVGQKGQVVIPKELRERFGLLPGVEVSFKDIDGTLQLEPVRPILSLGGIYAGGPDMAAALLEDRAREPR